MSSPEVQAGQTLTPRGSYRLYLTLLLIGVLVFGFGDGAINLRELGLSAIAVVSVFWVIVLVHELGHFWLARLTRISVSEFGIGFGPLIWKHRASNGISYALRLIPGAGYVALADPDKNSERSKGTFFRHAPVWRRALVVAGGPLMSLLMAYPPLIAYAYIGLPSLWPRLATPAHGTVADVAGVLGGDIVILIDGRQPQTYDDITRQMSLDYLRGAESVLTVVNPEGTTRRLSIRLHQPALGADGITPYLPSQPAVVDTVKGFPAFGVLRSGDVITDVDGQPIKEVIELHNRVQADYRQNQPVRISFLRNGEVQHVSLVPQAITIAGEESGGIGVRVQPMKIKGYDPRAKTHNDLSNSMLRGVQFTNECINTTLIAVGKIISGQSPFHEVRQQLSGPMEIAGVVSHARELGLPTFLQIIGLMTLSVGIFNLLPLPMLDGGTLVFLMIERAIGREPTPRFRKYYLAVGLVIIGSLTVFAIGNDVAKLLGF